jgi:FkbM family methyltransferase
MTMSGKTPQRRFAFLERVITAGRPLQVKGKGFLLDPLTPHDGLREVTVAGHYRMIVDLSNAIHRQIFMGCFARNMTRWAHALLPNGGAFLDVGAHAGYFSLLASHRVGPSGRVFAIEPNPRTFTALHHHLTQNAVRNVQAMMCGLADKPGSMVLHMPPSQLDYNTTVLPRADWTRVDVPARRLDDCVREWGIEPIDLMKIDVEGAEPLVLAGGADALARGVVRYAMIEVNGPRLTEGGSGPAALAQTLERLGFVPASIVLGRLIAQSWTTFDADPSHETDCLFVHQKALA